MLTVTTTHLKESYVRRNGVPRSDRAVLTEHWIRYGDYLTLVSTITDPVYLTEPFIRTTNWAIAPAQAIEPYPCDVGEEIERPAGAVPHHLPGKNEFLSEFPRKAGVPEQAARGGAETMYPEYIAKIRHPSPAPAYAAASASPPAPPPAGGSIHVQRVRGNVYMLSGAAANITIQAGNDGVLLVDAGRAEMTDQILLEVKKLSDKSIRYIVDTSIGPEHTGGNQRIAKEGETIAGGDVANLVSDAKEGATVFAHQNVLNRMVAPGVNEPPAPFGAQPTYTYRGRKKEIFLNDEPVQLLHAPAAHTDGDTLVFFRRSDVIATGDIFSTTGYPVIDLARGGSIQGEIDALNQIIDLTIPAGKEEGGTMVAPGSGRLCDEADIAYYRDMVTIIRDRIQDMKQRGLTLEQVQAARPTSDYDPRWGAESGPWTTGMFVEAVYKSLGNK
jgi:cyclase